MKLQSASIKEIKRISIGSAVCLALMIAAFFLLSQFGIGSFDHRVIVSGALGTLAAIANFTVLCLTIQKAAGIEDKKQMKARFQLSYNARMILQAGWTVIAFLVPGLHFIAGAAPVLFPKVTILYLQAKGKLLPPDPPRPANPESTEEPAASSDENL